MANPIDTTFSFVKETAVGVTPATPVFKRLNYSSGDFTKSDVMVTSDVLRQNRASAGSRKVFQDVGADLKTVYCRDTTQDMFWESCLSGTFTGNVLKGGNTDVSMTAEKFMKHEATNMYFRQTGMFCSKIGVSVSSNGFADASYGFNGLTRTESNVQVTGATTTEPTVGPQYVGPDVGTITIGNLTALFTSAELSIEQTRKSLPALGTRNAVGMGTGTGRVIKLSCKAYRRDLMPETTFAGDTPMNVTVIYGQGTGNTTTIQLPACVASMGSDEVSGESALISFDLWAQHDETTGTDIIFTKS